MSDRLNRRTGVETITESGRSFALDSGTALAHVELAWETYGTLNAEGDNVVLVCHALTGSAHAAGIDEHGRRGWWDALIGPGCALDTDRFFVVSSNVLGGCYGSTGPDSINPDTCAPFGPAFPDISIRDIVRAQRRLLQRRGVRRLHLALGGSMGGMQVLEWALTYPELVERIAPIATSAAHSPWCIGFNAVAREAIALGRDAGHADGGLGLARKIAMLTYRSEVEFDARFGRSRDTGDGKSPGSDTTHDTFAIQRYLDHHGRSLAARFSSESYLALTRAMDNHDVARDRGPLADVLRSVRQPTLCIGITSDRLYPAHEQWRLAAAIPHARYCEIDSPCGHDAFLVEFGRLGTTLAGFLAATAPYGTNGVRSRVQGAAA